MFNSRRVVTDLIPLKTCQITTVTICTFEFYFYSQQKMMHSSITRTIYHNSNVNLGPSLLKPKLIRICPRATYLNPCFKNLGNYVKNPMYEYMKPKTKTSRHEQDISKPTNDNECSKLQYREEVVGVTLTKLELTLVLTMYIAAVVILVVLFELLKPSISAHLMGSN